MSPTVSLRHRALIASVLSLAFLLLAALPASAQVRLSQDPSFNARAWTLTTPDADGTRYVGGDFTSYKAWRTGMGGAFDATTGEIDTSFPSVSGWPYTRTVISDGNGGWYVSGGINNVGGTGVSRVAHINADGSVDTNFLPSVSGGQGVWSLAKVGNTLLIGGDFTSVNGQTRTRLAALDASTGALLDWAPVANGTVWSIAVSGNTAYLGGNFTSLAGQTRNLAGAVRLDARTGGAAGTCLDAWDDTDCLTAWNPNVSGWGVLTLAVDGSQVFLGGAISSIGGQTRGSAGVVDATTGAVASWNPDFSRQVEGMAVANGVLYVVGLFNTTNGVTRNRAAAFDTSTLALTSWNPNINDDTYAVAVQGSTVYLGGRFTSVGSDMRNHAAAVDLSGNVVAWDPHICDNSNGSQTIVRGIAATPTKTYLLGDFPCAGGFKRLHTAAIGADGILTSWSADANGPVYAFSRLGSTIYMVGNFTAVNGAARVRAAAVTTVGSVTAWDPQPGGDRPVSVVATANKVYLGGFFGTIGGVTRRGVAAVDPTTGALDTAFDANLDGHVRSMALSGSTLYIGGSFANAGGAARDSVAGLNISDGSAVAGWNAGPLGADHGRGIYVENVTMDIDGSRVFLGGSFSTVNNVTRRYAVALDARTGAVDQQWAPPLQRGHNGNGDVFAIAPTADAIYLGGQSQMRLSEGGQDRYGLGAVDPQSGAILPWTADTSEVRGLSASDAAVFIAGSFSSVGGAGRNNTAAVDVDGSMLDPWPMDPAEANPLVITMAGTSSGVVVSNPGGINCGGSCAYAFTGGQSVTLTAVPAAGSDFDGWTGACTGDSTTCTVAMTAARSATATFVPTGTGGGGGGGGSTPPSSGPGSSDPGTDGDADTAESTLVAEPTVVISNRFTIGKARFVDGLVRLRVGVPGAGTVRMRVTRTVMRKGRAVREAGVCTTRIRFTGEGARVMRCRINGTTRALRTNRTVRLRVHVTYMPTGGSAAAKTTSLRLSRQTYSGAENVTG